MKRLIEYTVFCGLVTCWCLAIWPTRISPLSVNATTDGVSREPWALVSTLGISPSMMATTEFVVPKSMPMILDIAILSVVWDAPNGRTDSTSVKKQSQCQGFGTGVDCHKPLKTNMLSKLATAGRE